jgi:hypothetical protein
LPPQGHEFRGAQSMAKHHHNNGRIAHRDTPIIKIQQFLQHKRLGTTEKYVWGLDTLRPYLRVLEGGLMDGRSHTGTLDTK